MPRSLRYLGSCRVPACTPSNREARDPNASLSKMRTTRTGTAMWTRSCRTINLKHHGTVSYKHTFVPFHSSTWLNRHACPERKDALYRLLIFASIQSPWLILYSVEMVQGSRTDCQQGCHLGLMLLIQLLVRRYWSVDLLTIAWHHMVCSTSKSYLRSDTSFPDDTALLTLCSQKGVKDSAQLSIANVHLGRLSAGLLAWPRF